MTSRLFRPEWCVLVIGLLVGIPFAMRVQPLEGHDELDHATYALGVSHGELVAARRGPLQGMVLPARDAAGLRVLFVERYMNTRGFGLVKQEVAHYGLPGNPNDLDRAALQRARDRRAYLRALARSSPGARPEFVAFTDTVAYPPLEYLGPAGAMAAGRDAGWSLTAQLTLARLVGLLMLLLVVTLAVARFPASRWMLAACALAPVALYQGAMISADGLTNAFAFLVLATTIRLAVAPSEEVDNRMIAEAAIAIVALALCKPPYALLGLIAVVAVVRHRGRSAYVLAPVALGAIAFQTAWAARVANVNPYAHPVLGSVLEFARANPAVQEREVRHHPSRLLSALGNTVIHDGHHIVANTFFEVRWQMPVVVGALFAIALLAAAVGPRAADEVRHFDRALVAVLLVTAAAIALVILVAGYIGWNPVGAHHIDGVQGRYLLPAVVAALACVPTILPRTSPRQRQWFARATASALAVAAVGLLLSLPHQLSRPPDSLDHPSARAPASVPDRRVGRS